MEIPWAIIIKVTRVINDRGWFVVKSWAKLFIFISILYITIYPLNMIAFGMSDITEIFSKSQAQFVRMDITGQSKFKDNSGAESAALNLFKSSGIGGKYTITKGKEIVELKAKANDMDICIRTRKSSDENLVYASFLISQYSDTRNINNIRRTVLNAFKFYAVMPSFSSLIQGKYDGRLTISDMKKKASDIFSKSGAEFINGISDERLVSIYGLMPGMSDSVKVEGRDVNLNVALRYSSVSGCTYIWIANPVIAVEY